MSKHEWRKAEKNIYLPKSKPEYLELPTFKYLTISGTGDPNNAFFAEYIGVLYSLSYAIKMGPRKGMVPKGYYEYTVYPLEGVWDLSEEGRRQKVFNKSHLIFTLMIRQPDFVDDTYWQKIYPYISKKKPHALLEKVDFVTIAEGCCIQMLHQGSYDHEPESFEKMEAYAQQHGYIRKSKRHKEIYLSDFRKTAPEKLKTVLRFQVE